MDTKKVIEKYTVDKKSLRSIAEEFGTNHHNIKRLLVKEGVEINNSNRVRKKLSEEDCEKRSVRAKKYFSENIPYNKGKKAPKILLYKNMKAHLKYDVSLDWLLKFEDINKLKFLNLSITKDRDKVGFDTDKYKNFIEKFYYDNQFNSIYKYWLKNKKDRYLKPSLDHIIPKSKNGSITDLSNLQFLTWFENRCKNNMSMKEWNKLKSNIEKYFI